MRYYEVSPLTIVNSRESTLTYSSDEKRLINSLVTVEVGRRRIAAIVIKEVSKPSFKTKSILKTIEKVPLPTPLVSLQAWIAEYYTTHPALVWRTILPSGLDKKRRPQKETVKRPKRSHAKFELNKDQRSAIHKITSSPTGTHLLHGVTGSGKTAVYIDLAKQTVGSGRSVIVLVPEIALTSQLVADFIPHFDNVHVTHSTMTESARHSVWKEILQNDSPQVIIGPRSALFMPVRDLGLIIIDECHEPAFKQEKSPRYSAIRAASVLSKLSKARLVLGSATPSVVDYHIAKENRAIVGLPNLARQNAVLPSVELVDMTKRHEFTKSQFLSNKLLEKLTETLEKGDQSLIFHNRRGSAPITLCESCGWSASCPRCFIPLTLHADEFRLRCHLCNHTENIPTSCPSCHAAEIIHKGIGTKRVEEELRRLYPEARIARFDGDNTNSVDKDYQALYDGDIDIIIGTQVIAKGLDLPHLRFVGVVQADSGLSLPDYQSSERVFQLLAQVTGRVGRNEHPSTVIIQSYQPEHPSVEFGIRQNYADFYEWCIHERKRATFPPFAYLLRLTAVYRTEAGAIRATSDLTHKLRKSLPKSVTVLGPAPSFYERLRDTYRWQIILKSTNRSDLVDIISFLPPKGWQAELDPVNLL